MTTDRPSGDSERADVLLVSQMGGHLLQLFALRSAWDGYTCAWVTHGHSDARSLLSGERVYYAYGPTTRNVRNLVRNAVLAWRLLGAIRPRVLVTTGGGVSVPFAWVARLRGARVVYIESLTRIDSPSLSFRLVAPVADRLYAQWPEFADARDDVRYAGTLLVPS